MNWQNPLVQTVSSKSADTFIWTTRTRTRRLQTMSSKSAITFLRTKETGTRRLWTMSSKSAAFNSELTKPVGPYGVFEVRYYFSSNKRNRDSPVMNDVSKTTALTVNWQNPLVHTVSPNLLLILLTNSESMNRRWSIRCLQNLLLFFFEQKKQGHSPVTIGVFEICCF